MSEYNIVTRALYRHYGDFALYIDTFEDDIVFIHPEVYNWNKTVYKEVKTQLKIFCEEMQAEGKEAIYAYYFDEDHHVDKLAKRFGFHWIMEKRIEEEGVDPFTMQIYELPIKEVIQCHPQ
jgi:hypothetical protein